MSKKRKVLKRKRLRVMRAPMTLAHRLKRLEIIVARLQDRVK